MTAGFDVFDQMAVAATPPPRMVQPTAPVQAAPTAKRDAARLLRGAAYLAVFAGVLFLAALLVTVTPLGRIDADITVPFVAVVLGGLALVVWGTVRK